MAEDGSGGSPTYCRKGDLTNQARLKPSQRLSRRREGFVWVKVLSEGYLSWHCDWPSPSWGSLRTIIKVCWVICFAHNLFVPCQKSIVGRILVTSLGKYCKSKLLDWTFCWRKHRGCENWRGKDFLLLWVLVRSILGLLWVLVRYGLLGASF